MMRSSLFLVALATSQTATAQNFTIIDDGIVLPVGPVGSYHQYNIGSPSVVYNPENSEFVMYFEYRGDWGVPARCAAGAGTEWGLGRATSPDGITWTYDAFPSLHPVIDTFWECAITHPKVVYQSAGVWHLYFKSWQEEGRVCDDDTGNADGIPDPPWGCTTVTGVGYASSTDGINWNVAPEPILNFAVLDPTPEDFGWPRVVQVSGTWLMFMNYGDNGLTLSTAPAAAGPWEWEGKQTPGGYQEAIEPGLYTWMEDELIVAEVVCKDEPATDALEMFFGGRDRATADFWGTPLSQALGFAVGGVDSWVIDSTPEIAWTQADYLADINWRSWTVLPVGDQYIIYYQRKLAAGNEVGLAYTTPDTNWNLNTITDSVCNYFGGPAVVEDDFYDAIEDTPLVVDAATGVLGNDVDAERNALTAILVADVTNGTLVLNADGSFTYTPNADFDGIDSFSYEVDDSVTLSTIAIVTIDVPGALDLPVAGDDAYNVIEDTLFSANAADGVLANDFDPDTGAALLTASLQTDVSNGTLTLNADGSFDYVPDANFNGIDSFTYVAENDSASLEATVTLTVAAVNDAPTAADIPYNIDEDTTLLADVTTGVLSSAVDVDGDSLTADLVSDVSNGILTLNTDGSFDYSPNFGFNGDDTFVFRVFDGTVHSVNYTVTITVAPIADTPNGLDDAYGGTEDTTLVVDALTGLLANDTDGDGDPLTAVLVGDVSSGTLTLNADGSFTYVPNANFNGVDSFTYTANDGVNNSAVTTVTLTIASENDAPAALDDAYNVDEDLDLIVFTATGLVANDTDAENDPLTVSVVSDVSNGVLALNADGSFTYTPDANFNGVDSFTYIANDGDLDSGVATVNLTINSVEDIPVGVDDVYAGSEDTIMVRDALAGVLANDSDDDSDPLTAILVDDVSNGTLVLNADGSFTYTPNLNFTGGDSFTYTANDGDDNSAVTTVTLNIAGTNDAPVSADDAYNIDEDGSLVVATGIGVLANDTDPENSPLTVTLNTDVSNGVLALNADGSFTYTPDANFNGVDSFTYIANDGDLASGVATVSITVNAIEDLPIALDDDYAGPEDTPIVMDALSGVLGNDSDDDSDPLTAVLVDDVSNGTLVLNADGSFTYTPNLNFSGGDSFTYIANDGDDDSAIATVTLTISGDNDAPVATDDAYATDEDNDLIVFIATGVLANDTDLESDPLSANLVSDVSNGLLALNADGSFTYTPNANFNGDDTFTYRANDGTLDSGVVTVTITVNAIDDATVAIEDAYDGSEDADLIIDALNGVLVNDIEVDGDALTATLVDDVSNGLLVLNADGSFTYTPNTDFTGDDSFTYVANDGTTDSNTVTVTLTIGGINDAPVATDDAYDVDEDTNLVVDALSGVLANDVDPEGDPLTAVLDSDVSSGV
ncbi:MAG: tandem-95 repeat protein [Rhodobacterales bacterium]|nr:tandem-95 repeat protein [Rhodobacterales bacterium]